MKYYIFLILTFGKVTEEGTGTNFFDSIGSYCNSSKLCFLGSRDFCRNLATLETLRSFVNSFQWRNIWQPMAKKLRYILFGFEFKALFFAVLSEKQKELHWNLLTADILLSRGLSTTDTFIRNGLNNGQTLMTKPQCSIHFIEATSP